LEIVSHTAIVRRRCGKSGKENDTKQQRGNEAPHHLIIL
jgi:hypothetical protein